MGELVNHLILRHADWEQMQRHVISLAPEEEACGLVVGKAHQSHLVIEVENMLHSPTKFRMEAQDQFKAFKRMEALDLELLAIYHSHPNGPTYPSPTDLEEHAYPESAALIWYPEAGEWNCRGFFLSEGGFKPIQVHIENGHQAVIVKQT